MEYKYPSSRILLFAREPVYGQVKTRLQEHIGAARTLRLYLALLSYQLKSVQASGLAPVELWVDGNPGNPLLAELPQVAGIYSQRGADLGHRMEQAAKAALERAGSVILVGSDCPSVDGEYLGKALQLLEAGRQVVVGPAEDGGYVLLGLRGNWPKLFEKVPWGTDRVLAVTLGHLDSLQLDWQQLATLWDVDRPEDLQRLATLDPPLIF